jgi:hypothetical protein
MLGATTLVKASLYPRVAHGTRQRLTQRLGGVVGLGIDARGL